MHLFRCSFIFELPAHFHLLNGWYYRIFLNNAGCAYFKIDLGKGDVYSKIVNTTGKNITLLKHVGIYKLSIYKNN